MSDSNPADLVDACIAANVRVRRLEAAIRAHREEIQCCPGCGDDATAERRDADGELWALVSE